MVGLKLVWCVCEMFLIVLLCFWYEWVLLVVFVLWGGVWLGYLLKCFMVVVGIGF